MANGDLKSFLRRNQPLNLPIPKFGNYSMFQSEPSKLRSPAEMAIEIADGMAYISKKKFIHRDLAARNCMVHQNLTIKIGGECFHSTLCLSTFPHFQISALHVRLTNQITIEAQRVSCRLDGWLLNACAIQSSLLAATSTASALFCGRL